MRMEIIFPIILFWNRYTELVQIFFLLTEIVNEHRYHSKLYLHKPINNVDNQKYFLILQPLSVKFKFKAFI